MHDLKPGDIVALTEEAGRKSRFPDRQGTVVALGRTSSQIRVMWERLVTVQSVHCTLLQRAEVD
jgi:hypothetical protein